MVSKIRFYLCFIDMDMKFTTRPARPKTYAHNDVHFVCILADDETEITCVQFRAKFKQSKNVDMP